MDSRIALLGSGSLAAAMACAVARRPAQTPTAVRLLARNEPAGRRICHVANGLADMHGKRARVAFSFERVRALDAEALAGAFQTWQPDVVLVMASEYSPRDKRLQPNAWTELLQQGPLGVTLPLQAATALAAAEALAEANVPAALVNGCYPDAVNPLLCAMGYWPLAGVGNICTFAAAVACAVPFGVVRAIGHHWHLNQPPSPADEVRVWVDDEPFPAAAALLWQHRQVPREKRLALAGACNASLLRAWLDGVEYAGSVPGPCGLPGGYPVRVRGRHLDLDLPAGLSSETAEDWNRGYAERDGVTIDGPRARYSREARELLRGVGFSYADGFPIEAVRDVAATMASLRSRLLTERPATRRVRRG